MEKMLGKIENVRFGYVGYQDMMFGLSLTFTGKDGWGVSATVANSWSLDMDCPIHARWTEEDRDAGFAKTMRKINEIMKDAKVTDVHQLKGIPVEVTFEGKALKDWRILTEVL